MKLYHNPFSSNARKAVITSLLLNAPVELVSVDMMKGEHRKPEYLKLNPNGKVPTLVDGELALWESIAIMLYLADRHGETPLYPSDSRARADINRWLFWAAAHFTPAVSVLNFENMLKQVFKLGAPDANRVKYAETELATLGKVLDQHLAQRTWISGDALSFADIPIACALMTTQLAKLPVLEFSHVQRWFAQVRELDAWKRTEPPSF